MAAIVTLTLNPALDKITRVERVVPEKKLRCTPPTFDPGGGGINVARAAHALGGDVEALWLAGGPIGEILETRLREDQIAQRPIPIAGMTRENLIVGEDSSDQQYRFGMPGPTVEADEMERAAALVGELDPPPEYLVLSGSLPPGAEATTWAKMARRAPRGTRIILDTSGEALREGIADGVYLVKPNIRELGELAGRELESDEDIYAVAHQLVDQGRAEIVLVSLGSGGAILVTADTARHLRSPTVPIHSKVGAGDSTVAGVVVALARGWSVEDAAAFGVAAGAAAVMTEATELCHRDDTERLYHQPQEHPETA